MTELNRNVCSICFENINPNDSLKLSCNHIFHSSCINMWISKKNTCPICRSIVFSKFNVNITIKYKNIKNKIGTIKFNINYICINYDSFLIIIPFMYIKFLVINTLDLKIEIHDIRNYIITKSLFCIKYNLHKPIKYILNFNLDDFNKLLEYLNYNNIFNEI